MTVFHVVNQHQALCSGSPLDIESYLEWLQRNINEAHNVRSITLRFWDDEKEVDMVEKAKHKADWAQITDDYWCLSEQEPNSSPILVDLHHGNGWHLGRFVGMSTTYLTDERVFVAIYDETLALHFKLTFGL